MSLSADAIAELPGREVIAAMRDVLHDEDWRIRSSEEVIVKAGYRRAPDPEILSRAERFHALDRALDHAARAGPKATIGDFIKHLRDAWTLATRGREIDAQRAEEGAGQPGDAAADPPPGA